VNDDDEDDESMFVSSSADKILFFQLMREKLQPKHGQRLSIAVADVVDVQMRERRADSVVTRRSIIYNANGTLKSDLQLNKLI
jgi:hypothetical protein